MSHLARGPGRRLGIDGKANGAGRRRAERRVPRLAAEAAAP
jgi:hypothetical protein